MIRLKKYYKKFHHKPETNRRIMNTYKLKHKHKHKHRNNSLEISILASLVINILSTLKLKTSKIRISLIKKTTLQIINHIKVNLLLQSIIKEPT